MNLYEKWNDHKWKVAQSTLSVVQSEKVIRFFIIGTVLLFNFLF
jgi:hypothetical protein